MEFREILYKYAIRNSAKLRGISVISHGIRKKRKYKKRTEFRVDGITLKPCLHCQKSWKDMFKIFKIFPRPMMNPRHVQQLLLSSVLYGQTVPLKNYLVNLIFLTSIYKFILPSIHPYLSAHLIIM